MLGLIQGGMTWNGLGEGEGKAIKRLLQLTVLGVVVSS